MKYNNKTWFRIISSLMILMLILSFVSPFLGQELAYAEIEDAEIVEENVEELEETDEVKELEEESDEVKGEVEEINLEEQILEKEHILDGDVPNYGEVPDPSKVYKAEGREALDLPFNTVYLPSRYDLRTEGRLTPVKNQGNDGNCWAFACYGSLESHLINEGIWDFSENHLKNTHGFDFEINKGGNRSMATAYLARGGGPVSEEKDPYIEGSYWSDPDIPIEKIIKEVLYIPDRDKNSPFDNDRIKWAVMEYGGVHTSMYFDDYYFNRSTNSHYCYYDNGQRKSNHGVVIVGWDDNYSASNFSVSPPGNGAFIVRNSWGDDWGEGGYFYVSYYDKIIGINNTVYINAVDPDEYHNIYQYDELGWTGHMSGYKDETWGANVFECKDENEFLDAVSFYTNTENTQYEIYINSNYNLDNNFVNDNNKVAEGTIDMPGYHTIDLARTIPLTKGNKFSIAIKFMNVGKDCFICLEKAKSGYSSRATSNPGESFMSFNGQRWEDLGYNSNVCIKGFTKIEDIVEDEEYANIDDLSGGGHTIIIENIAYSRKYLLDPKNESLLKEAIRLGEQIYVKLSSEIYINQHGLVEELENIPSMVKVKR